jgi:hypothetical protein
MAEPGARLHLREIQRRAATSPGTASRELARLVAAGLIDREAEGNQVYFRASTSPFATMLRSVLVAMPAQTFAPRPRRLPRATAPQPAIEPEAQAAVDGTAAAVTNAAVAGATDEPGGVELAPALAPALDGPAVGAAEAERRRGVPASRTRPVAPKPKAEPDPVAVEIATRLADSVREIYGDSVRGVYLYGARAAGTGQPDSDVETIVVLDRVEHYGAELERTSHVCSGLSHELNLVISRIFVADEDWNGSAAESIRAEAVAV